MCNSIDGIFYYCQQSFRMVPVFHNPVSTFFSLTLINFCNCLAYNSCSFLFRKHLILITCINKSAIYITTETYYFAFLIVKYKRYVLPVPYTCHSSDWHMRYERRHIWVTHGSVIWYIYIYIYIYMPESHAYGISEPYADASCACFLYIFEAN